MLTLAQNPPMLSACAASLVELKGEWWVGHTKSRFEKTFAHQLLARGVGYFLPLVNRVFISAGKKRRGQIPLFPSYVFFCGSEQDRFTALSTNCLCQVIAISDQFQFVEELRAIELALSEQVPLTLYPFAVQGNRCRVKSGTLKGIEGSVVDWCGKTRLVLQVNMLGRGASLEIDVDLLEAIN
jgi:transcription antitermination factor NusG